MARYDLVSEKDGKLCRLQVKSASLSQKGSYTCCLRRSKSKNICYSPLDCEFIVLYAAYRQDFPDLFEDGYYIIPIGVAGKYRNATLFPPMKGRGNIKVCRWEEYRNGWERLQK